MGRTERWIKLRLHVRHPRIIDLADEIGCPPAEALSCAVDWFRQLDADAGSGRTYSAAAVDAAAGPHSGDVPFHLAARRIGWLVEDGSRLAPADAAAWFSRAAQERLRRQGDSCADRDTERAQRDTNRPERGTKQRQSRAESDEKREENDLPGRQEYVRVGSSTDQTGLNADQMRRQLAISQGVKDAGIAKNNAGRAINWLRNVIPDGDGFLRRIVRQAEEQGLFKGSPQHAMYVYGCIREEARQINGHNQPIDAPATVQHQAKHKERNDGTDPD